MIRSFILKVAFAAAALASISASSAYAREEQSYGPSTRINYSGYESPRGHYASLADFTRSIEGTPCGIECTQQHEESWGRSQR